MRIKCKVWIWFKFWIHAKPRLFLSELLVNAFTKRKFCCGGCFHLYSNENLQHYRHIFLKLELPAETKSRSVCSEFSGCWKNVQIQYFASVCSRQHSCSVAIKHPVQTKKHGADSSLAWSSISRLVYSVALPNSPPAGAGDIHFLLQ